jgi:hypothetical protein
MTLTSGTTPPPVLQAVYAAWTEGSQKYPQWMQSWCTRSNPRSVINQRRQLLLAPATMLAMLKQRPRTTIPFSQAILPPKKRMLALAAAPPPLLTPKPKHFLRLPPKKRGPRKHVSFLLPCTLSDERPSIDWASDQVKLLLEYRSADQHMLVQFVDSWVSVRHLQHCEALLKTWGGKLIVFIA